MKNTDILNGSATARGDLDAGGRLCLPSVNAKKNQTYRFTASVRSFRQLIMGHGKTDYGSSYLVLSNTSLTVCRYDTELRSQTVEHALSIAGDLALTIEKKDALHADITVLSGGAGYTCGNVIWTGDSKGDCFVESDGSILTDCVFTWSCTDFKNPLWIFGDSYCTFGSPYRWPWYLCEAGLQNKVHINAFPGESSPFALEAFLNSVTCYGRPETVLWTLGMNDGSDCGGAPCEKWLAPLKTVMQTCDLLGIELILATVPTVPERYHEEKNRFVRESGRRYIDFAEAVGADGRGNWRKGMLFTDRVHPDKKGAEALWQRIRRDLPELG